MRLVALLTEAAERALDRALSTLDAAGFPGLSPSHALTVQLIGAGVATTRDLAVTMRMTPQAVSAIVDQLEARGFVGRRRATDDARAKTLSLTADGRLLAASIEAALSGVEREWAMLVGEPNASTAVRALARWVEAGVAEATVGGRPRRRRVRIV